MTAIHITVKQNELFQSFSSVPSLAPTHGQAEQGTQSRRDSAGEDSGCNEPAHSPPGRPQAGSSGIADSQGGADFLVAVDTICQKTKYLQKEHRHGFK